MDVKKTTSFQVFDRMCEKNDQALKFAPLGNIIEAQRDKRGTRIVIGFGADVIAGIVGEDFVGGLILCDRKRFEEVKAEMEKEESVKVPV